VAAPASIARRKIRTEGNLDAERVVWRKIRTEGNLDAERVVGLRRVVDVGGVTAWDDGDVVVSVERARFLLSRPDAATGRASRPAATSTCGRERPASGCARVVDSRYGEAHAQPQRTRIK
jgi:hypothetical protein